jgi:SERRATE/Ars2, N-terminal domain
MSSAGHHPPPPPPATNVPRHATARNGVGFPGNLSGTGCNQAASAANDRQGPVSFKAFLLRQPESISPDEAQKRYNVYVAEFMKRQPSQFFVEHKDFPWFYDRYHPKAVRERQARIHCEVEYRAKEYARIWDTCGADAGVVNLSAEGNDDGIGLKPPEVDVAAASVAIVKKENSADVEAPDEATTTDREACVDDSSGSANAADETNKKEDTRASKEEDDLEGGGSDLKPAPAVVSNRQLEKKEGAPVPRENTLPLQREPVNDTVFMKNVPVYTPREALEEMMRRGRDGDKDFPLLRLKVGEVNPSKNMSRLAWAVYPDEETAIRAIAAVHGAQVFSVAPFVRSKKLELESTGGQHASARQADGKQSSADRTDADRVYVVDPSLNIHRKKRFASGRVLPYIAATDGRLRHDATQAEALMRRFDSMRNVGARWQRLTAAFLASIESIARRLDFCICYLREVHYFCYYSGNEYLEDPTSMMPPETRPPRKSGLPPPSGPAAEASARWERKLDDRVACLLMRPHDRPRSEADDGTSLREQKLSEWLDKNTKYEGPGRFRCILPPHKLFKGPEYVHKHIRSKHSDAVNEVLAKADEEQFRINFNSDPGKDDLLVQFTEHANSVVAEAVSGGFRDNDIHEVSLSGPGPGGPLPGGAWGVGPGEMSAPPMMYMGGMPPPPGMMQMMMPGGGVGGMFNPPPMLMVNGPPSFTGNSFAPPPPPPLARSYGMPQNEFNDHSGGVVDADGEEYGLDHGYGGRGGHHRGGRGGRGRGRGRGGGGGLNERRQRGGPRKNRPLDPRARRPHRSYNDLDAPPAGPQIDAAYDDL